MILKVKVLTKSSKNEVVGFEGDILKIRCTSVPEKGKANQTVIDLLSDYYHVSKSSIKILKGSKNSIKIIGFIKIIIVR